MTEASWPVWVVRYQNQQYPVMHVEHGGTTRNITADYLQIKVTLQAERDGDLQLSISRDLLNATGILPYYDSDHGFQGAVFVDSIDSLDYTTVQTEKAVVFTIPFAQGTEEIQIVGTFPVPGVPHLMITEVELSSTNGTQWIEVYNPTTQRLSTGAMLVNGSNVSLQFDGSSYSYAYVQPRQYQVIGLNYSAMPWDQLNQTISIYDTWSGTPLYWDKTPPLTDTFSDSRTWQRNGTDYWVFEEQTPMRAIPEFSNAIIMFLTASTVIGAVIVAIRSRGNQLAKASKATVLSYESLASSIVIFN